MSTKTKSLPEQMREIFDIIDEISDVDALKQISDYVHNSYHIALGTKDQKEVLRFAIGQNVKIKQEVFNRRGYKVQQLRNKTGEVIKVNQKTIKVRFTSDSVSSSLDFGSRIWKVPPSFLEIV